MHAGMPGVGTRVIRVMICNPLDMSYSVKSARLHQRPRKSRRYNRCEMAAGQS